MDTLNVLSPKKWILVYPSFSTWRRQYVLSHPVGKQSNEICPPFISRPLKSLTNRISQSDIRESFLKFRYEFFADLMFLVVLFISVTFVRRSISTHGRNIDHSSAEFHKCTPSITSIELEIPLDGNFQISHVMQTKIDELLVFVFT